MQNIPQKLNQEGTGSVDSKRITRTAIRETHIGFYLLGRCIAVYFTLTMILTFLAESLLNTIRLNKGLSREGLTWLSNNGTFSFMSRFYPEGNTPVVLISQDFVIVYLFAIAVYALVRFTYHKVVRDEGDDIYVGGLTWDNLRRGGQNIWIRLFWMLSPDKGAHMKIFGLWLVYIFLYGVVAALAGLIGISVYLSPEIKLALYGSGVAFLFGTLDDLNFFKKIPPKEAIVGALMALGEGAVRRDFSGTIKKLAVIIHNLDDVGSADMKEQLAALLAVVQAQEVRKQAIITSKDD